MSKIRVGVLRGGPSSEHEVSLKTGENVLNYLPEKYLAIDIVLDKNGQWYFGGSPINPDELSGRTDIIFNALHGHFGEDGKVQHILDTLRMPYTGSGVIASMSAMNKILSRDFFRNAGLKIPQAVVVKKDKPLDEAVHGIFRTIHPFWVVKPASEGSSIGVNIARNFENLIPALERAFNYGSAVLVEEYIKGREVTCGILDGFRDEKHYALPVIEIVPPEERKFFDYECKYDGSTHEICPAHFDISTKREIEKVARQAHKTLNCEGYSRADMIVSPKRVYLLEVNTLPGLTSESLLPKSASAIGLDFPNLIDHLINLALNRYRKF